MDHGMKTRTIEKVLRKKFDEFNKKFPDGIIPSSYVNEVIERVFG